MLCTAWTQKCTSKVPDKMSQEQMTCVCVCVHALARTHTHTQRSNQTMEVSLYAFHPQEKSGAWYNNPHLSLPDLQVYLAPSGGSPPPHNLPILSGLSRPLSERAEDGSLFASASSSGLLGCCGSLNLPLLSPCLCLVKYFYKINGGVVCPPLGTSSAGT